MSESVPPSTLEYETPPPGRTAKWPGYVAWAAIWIATGFMLLSTILPEIRGKKSADPSAAQEMQMDLLVKYAIGVREFGMPVAPLIPELEKVATTPADQIKIAIATGELIDGEAAIQSLERIQNGTAPDNIKREAADLVTLYTSGPDALDSAARLKIRFNYDLFGKIALSYKQPDSNPVRQEIAAQGKRTAIALFAALIIGSILALVGLVLLILAVVLRATGSMQSLYQPQTDAGSVYVEMFAVYLVTFIVLAILISLALKEHASLSTSWVLSIVLPLAIAWGVWRGQTWSQIKQALGWHTGRGLIVEVPLGLAGYAAGLPVVMTGFAITYLLMKLSGTTPSHPIQGEAVGSGLKVLQLYGIACIWAPVLEETMFRGALFHHLRGRWNWVVSAGTVAFIFAAIHPQGWTFIPVLGAIALVLAGLREWRGSIIPSMVAHACNNFMMVSLLIAVK